jgi:5-methylcytosine-specific restriction enzyme A
MPTAAPRPCAAPRCPALVTGKEPRCPEHRPKPYATAGRGSTRQWRLKRLWVRKEQGPLCPLCQAEGRVVVWTELDHVVPVAQGGDDRYENLQGLCQAHHEAKSRHERR